MLSASYQRILAVVFLLIDKYHSYRDHKIAFMATQIEILQARVKSKHIKLTPEERARLLHHGNQFDHRVDGCLMIVTLKTYKRWQREADAGKEPGRVGRKRICQSIADLVVSMAKNTAFGYRRIVGELKKLGIKVSASTVKHILKREGIHPVKGRPTPWRPARNWQDFIDRHMSSILGCDFMCARVFTPAGWVDAFLFVVIHLESRRVYISPATFNPNHTWLAQQVRNVAMWLEEEGIEAKYLIRDNDGKFGSVFDHTAESVGLEVVRTSFFAADMNAFTESFIGNTRRECLNHLTFFSLKQLDRTLLAWHSHYHTERPHRGCDIGNAVLDKDFVPQAEGRIICQRSLGGLLTSYCRAA